MTDLTGRVALVTGGSRGIGSGIARRLAADGADVAITYRHQAAAARAVVEGIERHGRRGLSIQVDASDADAIKQAIDELVARFGGVDILVNNAGYMDTSGTALADIPLEIVDHTVKVNARAAFLFAQSVAPHLKQGGRIINIGSCLGDRIPGAGLTLYAMSKAAISGLTKGLARDLASRGVTVNQVSPGPIDTDMNPASGPSADFQRSLAALGRYGTPEDIASAVSFLAGAEASFITGAELLVDGGTNV